MAVNGLCMFYYGGYGDTDKARILAAAPEFLATDTTAGSYGYGWTTAEGAAFQVAGIKVLCYIATGGMRGYKYLGEDASYKTYALVNGFIDAVATQGCDGIFFDEGGVYAPGVGGQDSPLGETLTSPGGISGNSLYDHDVGDTWTGKTVRDGYLDHAISHGLITCVGIDDYTVYNGTAGIDADIFPHLDYVLTDEGFTVRSPLGIEVAHADQCWVIGHSSVTSAAIAYTRTKSAWDGGFKAAYQCVSYGTIGAWFEDYIVLCGGGGGSGPPPPPDPPPAGSDTHESYTTGDDNYEKAYDTTWCTQTFTVDIAHTVTSVKLYGYKLGSPGTVTVYIHATTAGKPSGVALCSGTTDGDTLPASTPFEWREITLGAGAALSASTQYAIVVKSAGADASNAFKWRCSSLAGYAGGSYGTSGDSGTNWTMNTAFDFLFEEIEQGVAASAIDTENGIAWAGITTINGIAIANYSTVDGVST
jgi:hypothetical protein